RPVRLVEQHDEIAEGKMLDDVETGDRRKARLWQAAQIGDGVAVDDIEAERPRLRHHGDIEIYAAGGDIVLLQERKPFAAPAADIEHGAAGGNRAILTEDRQIALRPPADFGGGAAEAVFEGDIETVERMRIEAVDRIRDC